MAAWGYDQKTTQDNIRDGVATLEEVYQQLQKSGQTAENMLRLTDARDKCDAIVTGD